MIKTDISKVKAPPGKEKERARERIGYGGRRKGVARAKLSGIDLYCRKEPFGLDRYCQKPPFGSDFYTDINSSDIYD